ncbi:MAG: nucleotidyltransferase domain-containing protein [Nitrososphaerota archaeon]|nr:nucleotidyltransferase domain-containing protein [Candidatus Bathyarchaeota archaeon]MDW8022443.1 nucleotidyltransferase domain-containing protein [Nitrososphaerota archaeon]
MRKLPENVRRTLEKIVKDMTLREDVQGLGLFGSWSRGDAEASSDIDLLVVSRGNMKDEYMERIVINDSFLDLDFIPLQWIHGPIPVEIDQKLHEAQILYDRDWALANAKLLMAKFYSSPERVDMRAQSHIIDSDIYLSRATSAFSKGDFRSAMLFAKAALKKALKILMEITLEPFSNSRFLEKIEVATKKLGMPHLFDEYLEIAKLKRLDGGFVEEKIELFKTVWDEMSFIVRQKPKTLERAHFRVKAKLKYYFSPAFPQGIVLRAKSLIECKRFAEAVHYIHNTFLPIAENYALLKALEKREKIDHTCLIGALESLEKNNLRIHQNTLKLLSLTEIDREETAKAIKKVRETARKIRLGKKLLIRNYISKS